jgi:hypothetical protein
VRHVVIRAGVWDNVAVAKFLKMAGFLLVLAAVPAGAQAGLEHGHRLGTTVTYLEEPSDQDVRDGPANLQIIMQRVDGSVVPVALARSMVGTTVGTTSQKPCAEFETWAEQLTSDFMESAQTGVEVIERSEGKLVMQRFVRDNLRQIYVSYRMILEKLPAEWTYRVSLGPAEPPADLLGKADWKVLSPAKFPAPQIMKDEDAIRLELYSNGRSRRIVDYIHAGRQDRIIMRKETPHDSYAEDAELAVTNPRLLMNGAVGEAVGGIPETLRGSVLWVYVPGHGRYVLSLHAHAEFAEAGEAAGNSLTFAAPDGNIFRIDTSERVAAGSGSYLLYVLPDPGWEPADPEDRARVTIGAAPGLVGDRVP